MSRKAFFTVVRRDFYPNGLTQPQVDNINLIVDEFGRYGNLYWTAYGLATTYHETDATFEPIEEYGKGRGRAYGKPDAATGKSYYGRGFTQLTWKENYDTFSRRLNIDLLNRPELALQPIYAVKIMVIGMTKGLFTGVSLADFTHADGTLDFVRARKIVNGEDRAALIASYAEQFYAALVAADTVTATLEPIAPTNIPASIPAQAAPTNNTGAAIQYIATALTSKIVWAQIIGAAMAGGLLHGITLTPDQQQTVAQLIVFIITAITAILRIFFNQPQKGKP